MPEKFTNIPLRGKKGQKIERKPVKKDSHKGLRPWFFKFETQQWLILIALSIFMSFLLFPQVIVRTKVYQLGDIAERDIKAPHDFLLEDEELTEQNREEAVRNVSDIYDFDPTASSLEYRIKTALGIIREFYEKSETGEVVADPTSQNLPAPLDVSAGLNEIKDQFFAALEIPPDDTLLTQLRPLIQAGFSRAIEDFLLELLLPIFEKGIAGNLNMLLRQSEKGIILHDIEIRQEGVIKDLSRFYDLASARAFIKEKASPTVASQERKMVSDTVLKLALALVRPNLTFNKRETELRKVNARAEIKPVYYKIKKGEMLVREGERIGPEHITKLSEAHDSRAQADKFRSLPGMSLLIGLFITVIYIVISGLDRSVKRDSRDLFFLALTLGGAFIFMWAYGLIAEETARGFHFLTPKTLLYAMPVACATILVTIFQGISRAIIFALIVSILASLLIDGSTVFFIYFFLSSLVASLGVRNCRERGVLIKTGFKVGLINLVLVLALETIYGSIYSQETALACLAGFTGGILAGILATGIIPLVEMSFGYTTDIKLLELANLDQPLLRELMVRAPGTYHHSVMVSNMVEATAKSIHANPLLAKVCAYYHDIGKINKPMYFIENQIGEENRHEKLAPSMSSLILISHVKDGVELARKHKLGREITDTIQQHHGKNLITYFYQKAKEQARVKGNKFYEVKEEDFRYPGPKPQTKEAGLVMLADIIEAASKSLSDPTPARIKGLVQKLINQVFSDGQLDECELTLKDLHEIAKNFIQALSGYYHQRIEYPVLKPKNGRKTGHGNTDQLPAENSGAKKPEDQTGPEDGLRRLGQT